MPSVVLVPGVTLAYGSIVHGVCGKSLGKGLEFCRILKQKEGGWSVTDRLWLLLIQIPWSNGFSQTEQK